MSSSPSMELKRINRNRIFQFIMHQKTTSKSEISQSLHISLPTVIQNITELEKMNLISENGEYESTGGRRAKRFSCNAISKVSVGVDITKNHISIVVVNLIGEIVDSRRIRSFGCSFPEIAELIHGLLFEMLKKNNIDIDTVLGLGVSFPGIVSDDNKTVRTDFILPPPGNFYALLSSSLPFPCLFNNDANCGGFAELWSHPQTSHDIFYFSLSATVGGAAIIDGKIYTGKDCLGGEIGHMTLVPNGLPCYCGQHGCVDSYCNCNILAEFTNGNLAAFFEDYENGDPETVEFMEKYLDYLAISIHNVRVLLDCDIILGGYVGSYSELFLDRLKEKLYNKDLFSISPDYLSGCHYRTEAAAVGAALIFINRFIEEI